MDEAARALQGDGGNMESPPYTEFFSWGSDAYG